MILKAIKQGACMLAQADKRNKHRHPCNNTRRLPPVCWDTDRDILPPISFASELVGLFACKDISASKHTNKKIKGSFARILPSHITTAFQKWALVTTEKNGIPPWLWPQIPPLLEWAPKGQSFWGKHQRLLLPSVGVVDGATQTQKDDVESNGGSLENVAEIFVLLLCGVQLVLRSGVLTILELTRRGGMDVITPSFAEVFRSVVSGVCLII